MIIVDEMKYYYSKPFGHAWWCHLTSTTSEAELHEFAKGLGLKRHWFQDHPTHPHYDLVESMRTRALFMGAKPVTIEKFAQDCYAKKHKKQQAS